MGMSVDGFIARANGDIDWLGRPEYTSPDNLGLSYESFTEAIVQRREANGLKHLYIDGGVTVQQFLRAGLISDITITYLPLILGDGISLFSSVGKEIPLTHIETSVSSNGMVQSRYETKAHA